MNFSKIDIGLLLFYNLIIMAALITALTLPRQNRQSMKQKGLAPILIVILIALALGGYLVYQNQPKATPLSIQTTQSSPTPVDETANWKTYVDSWISFKYPANLYTKSGAQFGNGHIVSLVSDPTQDYRNGEFTIDSSLQGDLANYDTAVKIYQDRLTNTQVKDIHGGVIISGTLNNQMVSDLNVRYTLLKYQTGAILIKNEQFTSIVDDKTFDQILSTFKFTN